MQCCRVREVCVRDCSGYERRSVSDAKSVRRNRSPAQQISLRALKQLSPIINAKEYIVNLLSGDFVAQERVETRSIAPRNLNGKPDGVCAGMCAVKPEHPNNNYKIRILTEILHFPAIAIFRKHRCRVGRREDC